MRIPANNIETASTDAIGQELFDRLFLVISEGTLGNPSFVNKQLHEILMMVCDAALKNNNRTFSNPFSQIDYLSRVYKLSSSDRYAIQSMRRHTNQSFQQPISQEDFLYDLRALCIFISSLLDTPIPDDLKRLIPEANRPYDASRYKIDASYIRCVVQEWNAETIFATIDAETEDDHVVIDFIHTINDQSMTYLPEILQKGMQLNLLDCRITDGIIVPQLVIVEPDFLINIQSLAHCFQEYGHHPLTYLVRRFERRANSQPILLGHFAGRALDGIVNESDDFPFDINQTIINEFKDKALEYCSFDGFNPTQFKQDAESQVRHIQDIIRAQLPTHKDREKVMIEPSFICEKLGLQGRIDLMTTDLKLLVEQKSGNNYCLSTNRNGKYGYHIEEHYVQAMLYMMVLRYNYNLSGEPINIKLLYSKYPHPKGMLDITPMKSLFMDAMELRNKIVAYEYQFATSGIDTILPKLSPALLNVNGISNTLFIRYIMPQILAVTEPLQTLSPLEHAYFCRMMQFVFQEQICTKVGMNRQSSSIASLWQMPVSEKLETGNIYMNLSIIQKTKSTDYSGYDVIALSVPAQDENFLPNFRKGDMVYLYAYPDGAEPDVRQNILMSGFIKSLETNRIEVQLSNGQQNPHLFDTFHPQYKYAIEHGSSDLSTSAMIRGLHEFATAPKERKDLLLGQRAPLFDTTLQLSGHYDEAFEDVLLKAKQAKDYYLLVGPPGTGKTSLAMRYLVQEELTRQDSHILLLAYTNRAVDEICSMLEDAAFDYVRLGNELSMDEHYTGKLLKRAIAHKPQLRHIRSVITDARIIVCTTSALATKSYLFNIKRFTLAIIDEASQILEPNIMGILGAHQSENESLIDKFILIGDHKQLPAVVQQNSSLSAVNEKILLDIAISNCRDSLFERLIRWEKQQHREQKSIGLLYKQGRMHPEIAEFPNQAFYFEEQLQPVPTEDQKADTIHPKTAITDELDRLLHDKRMIFIATHEAPSTRHSDKVNEAEANIIADMVQRIYTCYQNKFRPEKTLGIIVPYRNQIAMIRSKLEKLQIEPLKQIVIDTVERFQGSQRDVIIYSVTVHAHYQMAFLTSNTIIEKGHLIDRKLNVALTRARKQMIIVGNPQILASDPTYHELMAYIRSKDGYRDQ